MPIEEKKKERHTEESYRAGNAESPITDGEDFFLANVFGGVV